VDGKVILYADKITGSMERAMAETSRRREKQAAFNQANGITPASIRKTISDIMGSIYERDHVTVDAGVAEEGRAFIGHNIRAHIAGLEKQMREAAADLEFETAARLRDEIKRLQATELAIADDPFARQSQVEMAVDDAMRTISTEASPSSTAGKDREPARPRRRLQRATRPNTPKTFGSRGR
jgi:excinuclease ABC subunit B